MPLKIVLVDDDEMSLLALKKLIPWSECGYELAGAFSCSDDAIDFINENPTDVLITDICMPKPDGLELVEIFSESHPDLKVIILSAHRDFSYAQKALRYKNVVDYLTKPLDYESLISALKKIVANQEKISPFSSRDDIFERLQLFSNLLCGNITDPIALKDALKSIGIVTDIDSTPCTMVVFHMSDFGAFQEKTSKYNSIQLYHAMSNMHPFSTDSGFFSLALCSYNNIAWLILHKTSNTRSVTEEFSANMTENFNKLLGIDVAVSSHKTYASITELVNIPDIESMEPEGESDDKIIDDALSYINDHLCENISLDDVASHVFMSPAYFSAYFKRKTGKKFIDKLTSIRMEKAAQLLLNDDSLSAAEISNMIGYNHIGYFYRKFKSYFGTTPTEYKLYNKK